MPAFDDDDDLESYPFDESPRARRGRREGSWDVEDEGPDERDLAPDTLSTVRCTSCRKLIFEDSVRCPYCKDLQMELRQSRRPIWFWLAVIFCALTVGGFGILWFLGISLWRLL